MDDMVSHYPAACIIESCSNTFECDGDRLILARGFGPLIFYRFLLIHPLPTPFSARFCFTCSRCSPAAPLQPMHFFLCITSTHQIPGSHFPFSLRLSPLIPSGYHYCGFFYLWLEFSSAHGNSIQSIKKASSRAPYCTASGSLPGAINAPCSGH